MTDESLDFSEFLDDEPPQPERVVVPRDTRSQFQKDRHEKFIDIAIATGNNSEAARQCGYKTPREPDSKYYRRSLAERRAQYKEQYAVTPENVIKGHAQIAFADIRNIMDDDGKLLPLNELDDETAAAVSGVEVTELGRSEGFAEIHKYKTYDKQKALDALSRNLGLFEKDNAQANAGTGAVAEMTKNEVARRLAFYLQETMRKQGEDGANDEAQAAE